MPVTLLVLKLCGIMKNAADPCRSLPPLFVTMFMNCPTMLDPSAASAPSALTSTSWTAS